MLIIPNRRRNKFRRLQQQTTTVDIGDATQSEINFPMTEEEEYENAGLTEEQKQHIEENTLSTYQNMKQLKNCPKKKLNNKKIPNIIQW